MLIFYKKTLQKYSCQYILSEKPPVSMCKNDTVSPKNITKILIKECTFGDAAHVNLQKWNNLQSNIGETN